MEIVLKGHKNIWLLLLLIGCIEPYTPPEIEINPNILVVDGFLDGTKGECIVRLSRTQRLGNNESVQVEIGAVVSLQEKDGDVFLLTDNVNGKYSIANLAISGTNEYRINVKTADGKEYVSEYSALKHSQPIDSLTWEATDNGVEIYATTHDDDGDSRYYQWTFVETWQYTSAFYSSVKFENGVGVLRNEDIYNCWREKNSSTIIIGSSDKLVEDIIYKKPITTLSQTTDKYQIRYSIIVTQRVLSKEAFNYWSELQKNTENLGTLFDPQPSQVLGNISNSADANEPVLGYFSSSYTSEKRLFIRNSELPKGFPFLRDFAGCKEDTIFLADLPNFEATTKILTAPVTQGGILLIGFRYSSNACVDCRLKGGTTTPPDFW